jgi:hypothetical protein
MSVAKVLFLNLTFVYVPKNIQFFMLAPLPVYYSNPSPLAKTVDVASHVAVVIRIFILPPLGEMP